MMHKELHADTFKQADILVLPIVGTDEKGQLNSVFTSKKLVLTKEHMESLPKHCIVYAGIAGTYLKDLCRAHQIQLIQLLDRDDVAIYNSIPTVEGAIMMAIQHTDFTIHHSNCIVLGLGRVGMTLARILAAMGAKVKVGVRSSADIARAFEMGLQPFDIAHLAQKVQDADFIFNTVPALIMTASVLAHVPHDAVIIDLASKPGGVDYPFAEKRGIKAILAPSLPGIVAPKTAGKILAKTMTKLMMEAIHKEGDPIEL
jgi:dipicolinate synthase subunit A